MEQSKMNVGGVFHFKVIRDGEVVDEWDSKNIVVDEGLDYILGTSLKGTAQKSTWYLGVFSGIYSPDGSETGATIATDSTESSAYSEWPTRPTWAGDAVSGQSVTNSTQATFTINNTVTMQGAFLTSSNAAASDATATLYAASAFTSARSLVSGDILQVGYTLTATSA